MPSDITDDDAVIERCLKSARKKIEMHCGVSILARTVTARLQIQAPPMDLPFGPVDTFTSLTVDGDTIDADNYDIEGVAYKTIDYETDDATAVYATTGISDDEWNNLILRQFGYTKTVATKATRLEASTVSVDIASKKRDIL